MVAVLPAQIKKYPYLHIKFSGEVWKTRWSQRKLGGEARKTRWSGRKLGGDAKETQWSGEENSVGGARQSRAQTVALELSGV